MEIISVVIFCLGIAIGYFISSWLNKKSELANTQDPKEIEQLKLENNSLKKDVEHFQQRIDKSLDEFEKQKTREQELITEQINLSKELAGSKMEYKNLQEKLEHQSKELEEIQERFTKEFKLIANAILKENSEELSKKHHKELDTILNPLQEKIKSFEEKVEKNYRNENDQRIILKEELKRLMELNQTLNSQAQNLTNALKGENKTQGNWGELVLERILESSGLIKGEEYLTQHSDHNTDDKRIQPDVVIKLPDNKHIIVDSKVSLTSYERYVSSTDDAERENELKKHILSVRNHIKFLGDKNYQSGLGLNSPDFVLLFIPIESSFSIAMQGDLNLYNYAWERKVVIVTPTTLLATLRTIASVWKHERQNKNAIEIADKAGRLYDKFKSFVDDLQKIDRGLSQTRVAYDDAMNKLKTGKGNLIGRAELIKSLGAKTTKDLPIHLIEDEQDEDI